MTAPGYHDPPRPAAGMHHRAGHLCLPAAAAAVSFVIAGCMAAPPVEAPPAAAPPAEAPHKSPAHPSPAALTVSPADGSRNVATTAVIRVSATHARVSGITVTLRGRPVAGVTAAVTGGGTVWRSRWALHPASTYRVVATGTSPSGAGIRVTSSFRTLTPPATVGVHIVQGSNQTYGVGMPVILSFTRPVTRRAAVERALELRTSRPVVGAWYWDGSQTLYFRPREYWPQGTRVRVIGHFDGVQAARGVYGTANLAQQFRIGASLIVSLSTRTHYLRVWYRQRLIGRWPISTGRPGYDTPNGTYLTIEKGNPVRMTGPDYDLLVPYSVRFTWGGIYLHAADWSLAAQGVANVSHGCVNMSPAHAAAYYRLAHAGDPVTVTGSPNPGTWGDGWTVWFWTWQRLLRGSALGKAVLAGPAGSRFASPSSLGPWSPSPPLHAPAPGNFHAG